MKPSLQEISQLHHPKSPLNPQILTWKFATSIKRGFRNIGNTCFLNSTLQCLLYTPPIQNCPHTCKNFFCVVCSLKELFTSPTNHPHDFIRLIERFSKFQVGRQEDAHEFLRFLIDRASGSEEVAGIFCGQLLSQVICRTCQEESVTSEPFYDLSLEMCGDLKACVQNFFKEEELTGQDAYRCLKCESEESAEKKYAIKEPPMILTLHFKRFNNKGQKNMKAVKFEEKVSLKEFLLLEEEAEYELYGVLVHVGYSCRSGHYYCYVKGPNKNWFECNDELIREVSLARVLQTGSAYILFYKKIVEEEKMNGGCENSSELILPEKRFGGSQNFGSVCKFAKTVEDKIRFVVPQEEEKKQQKKHEKSFLRRVNHGI